jgi:deferrochelatase/peroxidase EfeB
MARRGIPYGLRNVSTEIDPAILQMPKGDVGLLFMSYQKSITNQFEFIQQNWANNRDFAVGTSGIDPIIGQSVNDAEKAIDRHYNFPHKYGIDPTGADSDARDFKDFVEMKGGEYFFAPSISFLKDM